MVNIPFNIHTNIKGLKNLIKMNAMLNRVGKRANRGFGVAINKLNKFNGALDRNNQFLSRSADRIGFMAFQFTFIEGIAQRVLGNIQRFFSDIVTEGASSIDQMVRAVAQSGIDFSGDTEESRRAIEHLNNALMDMGSGGTVFSITEVSEAMKEIGKATNLSGTEMQKANKLVGTTQQVLRMMAIEEVDAAEASKQLIKTINNFGLSLDDAARVTNVMINVNQSSAITLDELSRSFGFASSQAQKFGMDVETTGALIGVLGNRLGQGAGAAGRNFRQLLAGLEKNALKSSASLDFMGISLLNNNKNIKPFIQYLNEVRSALDEAGQSSDAFRIFLQNQMGLEIRAADALAKLTQVSEEEINRAIETARSGDASALEELFGSTPEANIKKMTNAVNGLKTTFTAGLAPAITKLTGITTAFVRETGLQNILVDVGTILGDELIPVVEDFAKELKGLIKYFQENRDVLRSIIKYFIWFVQILVATLILASVGKVVAAFGSILAKLSLPLSAVIHKWKEMRAQAIVIRGTFLGLFIVVAGLILVFFGFKAVMATLIDGEITRAEAPILALGVALTAVGLAISFAAGGVPGLIAALALLAGIAVGTWLEAIGAIDAFDEAYQTELQNLNESLTEWEAFGVQVKAVMEGISAAGTLSAKTIIVALADLFSGVDWDGLTEDWDTMWKQLEEGAILDALITGARIGQNLILGFVGLVMGTLGLSKLLGDDVASWPEVFQSDAFTAGEKLGQSLADGFVFVVKKLNPVSWIFDALKELDAEQKIADLREEQTKAQADQDMHPWLFPNQNFGGPQMPDLNLEGLAESGEKLKATTTGLQESLEPLNETMVEVNNDVMPAVIEAQTTLTDTQIELNEKTVTLATALDDNTGSTQLNTAASNVHTKITDNATSQKHNLIKQLFEQMIETARETNMIIDLQTATNALSIALTKMAIEGTEAARRMSTLKVSTSGKYSMDGRQTTTTFSEIPSLQNDIRDLLAIELGQKQNLNALKEKAKQIINVGGISINVEGNVDEENREAIIAQISEELAKQLDRKTVGSAGVQ